MKAITKSAFFFLAMFALVTSCSTKKTETSETNMMATDSSSMMMTDSTMATDTSSMMMSDSAR